MLIPPAFPHGAAMWSWVSVEFAGTETPPIPVGSPPLGFIPYFPPARLPVMALLGGLAVPLQSVLLARSARRLDHGIGFHGRAQAEPRPVTWPVTRREGIPPGTVPGRPWPHDALHRCRPRRSYSLSVRRSCLLCVPFSHGQAHQVYPVQAPETSQPMKASLSHRAHTSLGALGKWDNPPASCGLVCTKKNFRAFSHP